MATRFPYSVSDNDIYTQIMRQMQQSRPAALANPYENFTGGYNPDLYNRPMQEGEGLGGMVPGLLDTGGGIGETSTTGASYSNPADAIAAGQAMQGYGKSSFGLAPGSALAGLLGSGLVSSGISQLGALEAAAAQAEADAAAMDALAGLSDASVGLGELGAIGAADIGAIGAMGLGLGAGDLGGLGAGDALGGYAGGADIGGIGGMGLGLGAGDLGGLGGGDVSGGYGGVDSGGYGGDGAGGYYYKGGKVTMDGLLTNVDLPTPDDGYGALQAGEYVIKKSTVDKLGDKKLKALNEGRATIKMRK